MGIAREYTVRKRDMHKAIIQHTISFKHAFDGLRWAIQTQPNFRIHIFLTLLALTLAWYFRITRPELIVILFTIVLGFTAEMINTSIEAMTDLITTEYRKDAKIAKDVAAGMMLVTAVGAAVVGCVIFIPYIQKL